MRPVVEEWRHADVGRSRPTAGFRFIVVIDPRDTSRLFARNLDDLALTSEGRFDQARLSNVLRSAHDHVRQHAAAPSEPGWFRRKLIRWWNS